MEDTKHAADAVRGRGGKMTNVYIEPRPKGHSEGSPIEDYVAEDHADHVLATFKTQQEAIEWAKKNGHIPLVARARRLNDKKKFGHGARLRYSAQYGARGAKMRDRRWFGGARYQERRTPVLGLYRFS
jgi:hypothetical protein